MLLGTLGASLLGNILSCQRVNKKGRGINRTSEGIVSGGEGIIKAGYGNKNNEMDF